LLTAFQFKKWIIIYLSIMKSNKLSWGIIKRIDGLINSLALSRFVSFFKILLNPNYCYDIYQHTQPFAQWLSDMTHHRHNGVRRGLPGLVRSCHLISYSQFGFIKATFSLGVDHTTCLLLFNFWPRTSYVIFHPG
jgi:hypothetical protein